MGSGHDHHHDHGHHHHHAPHGSSSSILWGLILNTTFTIVEIAGGALTGSVAVLANAVHDLGDSASLALAVYFERYSRRERDPDYSFGYRRFSLLSALISGFIILAGSILILRESLPRLWHPEPVHAGGMLGLALLGLAFNGLAAFKLSHGHSQNEKMLSWHFIEDTLGWLATLIASALMKWRGWSLADPILAIGLSAFVMWNVFKQLKMTFRLFLQGTPLNFNEKTFLARAKALAHVSDVHDLHVWSMDGENHVLSMHVILDASLEAASVRDLKLELHEIAHAHHVRHVTIETEVAGEVCGDNCDQDKIKP